MEGRTIETLEETLQQAMLNSVLAALDQLIAEDLMFTLPTGVVIDKQADLDAHRSGLQKFTKVETDEPQIHHYGEWAVVTLKTEIATTAFSETYCFTRVWAKRQNRWQIVAGRCSPISE